MDILLSKVTQQAMNYAIRSGVTITATYALKQCGRLLKTVEGYEREELATLQLRLDAKIKIISPAIDMVELIAARGNTSLESAVTLTKSLRWDIQSLGSRVEKAVGEEMLARKGSTRAKSRAQNDIELKIIIAEMKKLLNRIEDAVPLISLAITTSGVNLSTTLPATVSPSRLLQASTFLTSGDMQYCATVPRAQQIGPTFNLSMYMLFAGHTNRPLEEGARETTWKEVMHKARVTLLRVPLSNVNDYPVPFGNNNGYAEESRHSHIPSEGRMHEFAYQLLVVEDFDDGRVHDFDDGEAKPEPYDGIKFAGIREVIPIHQISKIFYADTGKILNIGTEGETNNPILLLKRDIRAEPPRRMLEREHVETGYESDGSHTVGDSESDEEQTELDDQLRRESTPNLPEEPTPEESHEYPWRLPPTLDLEWMAFEVYTEELTSDSDIDDIEDSLELDVGSPSPADTRDESPGLSSNFSRLDLRPSTPQTPPAHNTQLIPSPQKGAAPVPQYAPKGPTALPAIKTSLSLLEMLIRLTALQQFQQSSHLAINDEYLNFFLSDSSTVGAGGDAELRRQVRRDARMRVGFDPYDESPIRRRGEDYLEHELHDDNGYGEFSPIQERPFDYDSYPHGKASTIYSPRSRSATPTRSPSLPNSTPPQSSGRSKSSADAPLPSHEHRPALANLSSASPLLRRATTQPNQNQYRGMKQPSFRGPPTAPPSSSSPRTGQTEHGAQQPFIRESSAPDTPPDSVGRNG